MKKEHHVALNCSFCGKSQRQVKKLVAGPIVYICDECIRACVALISEHTRQKAAGVESMGTPKLFIDDSVRKGATPAKVAAWLRSLEAELRQIPLARPFAERARALTLAIDAAAAK